MLNVDQLRKKFQEIRAGISKEELNNWLDKAEEREKFETNWGRAGWLESMNNEGYDTVIIEDETNRKWKITIRLSVKL